MHEDDGSTVIIRLRDVYEIAKRTEEKVDLVAYSVGEKLPDHEARLRSMERRVWAIPSLSAIIAVISLVVALHQHSVPTTTRQSAPRKTDRQVTVSTAPRTTATTTAPPTVVQVTVPRTRTTTSTSAAPSPATTTPATTPPSPPATVATTLVGRIENLTSTVNSTVASLTKDN